MSKLQYNLGHADAVSEVSTALRDKRFRRCLTASHWPARPRTHLVGSIKGHTLISMARSKPTAQIVGGIVHTDVSYEWKEQRSVTDCVLGYVRTVS